ncbi:hypothetical protein KC343_g2184 [Hortaea werneckii]|nr:hypothetical protein KC317_g1943 [Hortaea werneckii]KAI7624774.1 hypothetical protein KC346_g2060 [Hortaea werneckii]KAI7634820.1 hypothetical protein KC343_g2184 [Hortaea werneckii]KAI7654296.1 hypothetical protein KC319_g10304 [Hortaea werneckii]KAI7723556.1 hypothetical protein KC322_g852 [Hortaea werneckii]
MLIQPKKGVVPALGVGLLLLVLVLFFWGGSSVSEQSPSVKEWASSQLDSWRGHTDEQEAHALQASAAAYQPSSTPKPKPAAIKGPSSEAIAETHNEISSSITSDGSYFPINFGEYPAMNPNIIPHPELNETWFIVAQRYKNDSNPIWFTELVCEAHFKAGALECIQSPLILPIPSTFSERCEGDLSFFNFNIGPHDARVFCGPEKPYVIYGSQSSYNCFGQWIQDFRALVDWAHFRGADEPFSLPVDLQRPPPIAPIEKNWFPFWDFHGDLYMHYDISPNRVYAKLGSDGSVGEDLAPKARRADEKCLSKYMAPPDSKLPESIHQATNSLSITMCKSTDPSCKVSEANTFIFTIVQRKAYYDFHSVYEPYVVLFNQRAPFELHAISSKPFWIRGRENKSEMMYVTSMSWKSRDQMYHGYLDDMLFVGFGIEDQFTGGMDVLASDLLRELGMCGDL